MPGTLARSCSTWRGGEHLVDAAVTTPQQHFAGLQGLGRVAPQFLGVRVPNGHGVERHAHRLGRIAPQVLIGKEQHAAGARERPAEYGGGIAGGADDAAMPAAEGFETGGRVNVRNGRNVIGVDELAHLLPSGLDLFDGGHVGHRTAGGHVGEHHGDALAIPGGQLCGLVGQDVGRFGHEVHAAEGDGPAIAAIGRHFAELVAISPQVRQRDHFVLLVVMAQDQ